MMRLQEKPGGANPVASTHGVAIYVPANAEHDTKAGPEGLRFAYGFAAASFEQITYRFSAATEARG